MKNYTLLFLLAGPAFGQIISPPLIDFTLVGITKPMAMGSTLPDTCQDSQLFFLTSAPAGANVFSCANNVWASIGSGVPPSLLPTATSSALGMVMVPDGSGLTLSAGALSVQFPTLATVARTGSYSDILNIPLFSRVATTGSYPDLLNKPVIPTNTNQLTNGSGYLTTFSNAASATRLAATPAVCLAGQYSSGINTLGGAYCGQVQYSQLSGVPAPYSLPTASTTTRGGIMSGTGLTVLSGVMSVMYGTGSGTAAQGNDSRIVGALQKATGLADLKLTGLTPVTINSPTTGNAATATRAGTAATLQGSGILRMKGPCGPFPFVNSTGGTTLGALEIGLWLDTDCNLHGRDQANLNRSVMVWTWKNGVEQKCDQSLGFSAMTDFSASGIPVCTLAPAPVAPTPPPSGITASGSACTITAIDNGVITAATCIP